MNPVEVLALVKRIAVALEGIHQVLASINKKLEAPGDMNLNVRRDA